MDEFLRNLRLRVERDAWMVTSLVLALCAIMMVAVRVLPLFGPRVAVLTPMATVLGIVIICYLLSVPRVTGRMEGHGR